jgi:hypothetical protein
MVAVLGGSRASAEDLRVAERVGAELASGGAVVLTGGGSGVMEAASRGAAEAGGITVGVLPSAAPTSAYPNPWVQIPVFTGLGSARNAVNVLSAQLCIAVGGGPGTLSEVALAMKAGIDVWWFGGWRLGPPASYQGSMPRGFEGSEELFDALATWLRGRAPRAS